MYLIPTTQREFSTPPDVQLLHHGLLNEMVQYSYRNRRCTTFWKNALWSNQSSRARHFVGGNLHESEGIQSVRNGFLDSHRMSCCRTFLFVGISPTPCCATRLGEGRFCSAPKEPSIEKAPVVADAFSANFISCQHPYSHKISWVQYPGTRLSSTRLIRDSSLFIPLN